MKRLTSLLLSTATASLLMAGSHGVHWGYSGHAGPENWGNLSDKYIMCKLGKNQSPIDIKTDKAFDADLPTIGIDYKSASKEELNNGHTVQVNIVPGSSITVDGIKFELKQFHFHTPSENTIDGQYFPLEAHFVHADENGNLAVIGVMFKYGAENEVIKKVWEEMPEHANDVEKITLSAEDVKNILPKNREYYRFNGSLTTPPCSEGVRWFVMKQPVTISKEQVKKFADVMHHPNNRPVQPINARVILK